jgi:hypothetical protein
LRINRILQLAAFAILFAGCHDPLTPATFDGRNTLSCELNGVVHSDFLNAQEKYLLPGISRLPGRDTGTVLDIQSQDEYIIILRVYDFKGKGIYHVGKNREADAFVGDDTTFFRTIMGSPGYIFVTKYDESERVLAGTFSFLGFNINGDSVEAKNGRFDLSF